MARKRQRRGKPDMRLPWLLFGLGGTLFVLGAWGAYNGFRTLQWPRATAEIVDANLTRHERETREVNRPDRWHTFAVHYLYRIEGKTYLGGGIEPYDFGMQNSAGAVNMANTYRIGSMVQVAYEPGDPSVAYLMPGPSSFSLMLMGIGVGFGVFGLLARRMIRVGPGDDDDDKPKRGKAKTDKPREAIDPQIASFYPNSKGTPPTP